MGIVLKTLLRTLLIGSMMPVSSSPAAEGLSDAFSTCIRELQTVIYSPKRPGYKIVTQLPKSKGEALAQKYLVATDEFYSFIPEKLAKPSRAEVELKQFNPYKLRETNTNAAADEINVCFPRKRRIVCGVPHFPVDESYLIHIYQHEAAHLVSYYQLKKAYPEFWARKIALSKALTSPEIRSLKRRITTLDRRLKDLTLPLTDRAKSMSLRAELKGALEDAKAELEYKTRMKDAVLDRIWQGMDEVFADTVPVMLSGDPAVVTRAIDEVIRPSRSAAGRDFSQEVLVGHDVEGVYLPHWNGDHVHVYFTPVRYHLWSQYLKNADAATKRVILERLHETMVQVIRKAESDPTLITYHDATRTVDFDVTLMNERWIEEIDQAMGRAPEAQRALNKGNPSEIPKLLAP